mmetsp:Transcript_86710/g.245875  ORF Transcript_86710/g.245875 Transcript_86710/m.245875 type:complete len:174 (-) Transcript_86710:366-887(-)
MPNEAETPEVIAGVVSERTTGRTTGKAATGTAAGGRARSTTAALEEETAGVDAARTSEMMDVGVAPVEVIHAMMMTMTIAAWSGLAGATAVVAGKQDAPTTEGATRLHTTTKPSMRHEGGGTAAVAVAGATEAMATASGTAHARLGTLMAWCDMLAKCQLGGTRSRLRTSQMT